MTTKSQLPKNFGDSNFLPFVWTVSKSLENSLFSLLGHVPWKRSLSANSIDKVSLRSPQSLTWFKTFRYQFISTCQRTSLSHDSNSCNQHFLLCQPLIHKSTHLNFILVKFIFLPGNIFKNEESKTLCPGAKVVLFITIKHRNELSSRVLSIESAMLRYQTISYNSVNLTGPS